jgi:glycosyltransferase involved in cell wall biosynthesis
MIGPKTVSVVIPTYNRPDALSVAIKSVLLQTHPVFEVIIVGDSADVGTEIAVRNFNNPKLQYINLPTRCGDQSIPNAIGTQISKGEYIAYLNHDDVWGATHIEDGLRFIESSGAKWFIGQSLFAYNSEDHPMGRYPIFSQVSDPGRRCHEAFGKTFTYLETNSSWIVPRDAILEAGNWYPASSSRRTPLTSLGLRLWRQIGEPGVVEVPTVAKILGSMNRRNGRLYGSVSLEHSFLSKLIDSEKSNWFEALVLSEGETVDRNIGVWADYGFFEGLIHKLLVLCSGRWSVRLFQVTGIDLIEFVLMLSGVKKGSLLGSALVARTGETQQKNLTVKKVNGLMARNLEPIKD